MVRILEKYGIEVSEKCYAVGKIRNTTDKITGQPEEEIQSPAYCTTLEGALQALRRKMHLDAIKPFDGTLEEAVEKIRSLDDRFCAAIEGAGLSEQR